MFSSFCIRRKFSLIVVSRIYKPCFLQLSPFSSAAKSNSKISNEKSFAVNYLINTLGFSPERAISTSKYIKLESREKADSVIAFLKNHGFTQDQIGKLARHFPAIIVRDPQKSLLPKIEFFKSASFSETEVINIFSTTPSIFGRSLERQIIPSFNYVKSLFDANGTSIRDLKHATAALCYDLHCRLIPNVAVLKEAGVPDSKIVYLLQYYPKVVKFDSKRFRKIVEDVKEMGFNPLGLTFILAVSVLQMNKANWENKVAVYKTWGVSEDEIISAFRKHPQFMNASVEKINAGMDLFVNELGFDSSYILKAPSLVLYSLDKRLKPRSSVYKVLVDNGIIKTGAHSAHFFQCTENVFLEKYVQSNEEKAPGLLQLYQKERATSKGKDMQKKVAVK